MHQLERSKKDTVHKGWYASPGVFSGEFNLKVMVFQKVLCHEVFQAKVKNSEVCRQCQLAKSCPPSSVCFLLSLLCWVLLSLTRLLMSDFNLTCFGEVFKVCDFFHDTACQKIWHILKWYLGQFKSSIFYLIVLEGQPFWLHRSWFGQSWYGKSHGMKKSLSVENILQKLSLAYVKKGVIKMKLECPQLRESNLSKLGAEKLEF